MTASEEPAGLDLTTIAAAVRGYKSAQGMSLGAELARLTVVTPNPQVETLQQLADDIASVTRAHEVVVTSENKAEGVELEGAGGNRLYILPVARER